MDYTYVRKTRSDGSYANPWDGASLSFTNLIVQSFPNTNFKTKSDNGNVTVTFQFSLDAAQKSNLDTAYTDWNPDNVI